MRRISNHLKLKRKKKQKVYSNSFQVYFSQNHGIKRKSFPDEIQERNYREEDQNKLLWNKYCSNKNFSIKYSTKFGRFYVELVLLKYSRLELNSLIHSRLKFIGGIVDLLDLDSNGTIACPDQMSAYSIVRVLSVVGLSEVF